MFRFQSSGYIAQEFQAQKNQLPDYKFILVVSIN